MIQFLNLFNGAGLLKDRTIKLCVDDSVTPVSQPYKRIPIGLRTKVERKLQELVESDTIEPTGSVSDWVSPVVAVPEPN